MLRLRKMAAATVVICMMLTLLPVLAVGDLSVGVAHAASVTTGTTASYSSTTTTDPSDPGPSATDIADAKEAVDTATDIAGVEAGLGKMGNSDNQASGLEGSGASNIIAVAGAADSKIQELINNDPNKTLSATIETTGSPEITVGSDKVVGLITAAALQDDGSDNKYTAELAVAAPAESVKEKLVSQGTFEAGTVKEVDIKLLLGDSKNSFTGTLKAPIYITITIDGSIDMAKLRIVNIHNGQTKDLHYYWSGTGREVTFGMTEFSTVAYGVGIPSTSTSGNSKDTPTPIVPVLYDITKAGDTFSYKVLIANGGGNMSGATVTVSLNDRYKSTVTIGSDGIGQGTLEASGFAAGVAVFYARINGISNPGVTKPMIVSSSGRVLPR